MRKCSQFRHYFACRRAIRRIVGTTDAASIMSFTKQYFGGAKRIFTKLLPNFHTQLSIRENSIKRPNDRPLLETARATSRAVTASLAACPLQAILRLRRLRPLVLPMLRAKYLPSLSYQQVLTKQIDAPEVKPRFH